MGERPVEQGMRDVGEGEARCVALAALGFPVVLFTLLAHGLAIFAVRQGYWSPTPGADTVWSALVIGGVVVGLGLSACPAGALRKN